jgi:hypothetical protein
MKNPSASGDAGRAPISAIEKHYRVKELRTLLGLSDRSTRRLIADEADVIVLPQRNGRFKRSYETTLIPESVVRRMLTRYKRGLIGQRILF